jgi:hypothetical protein
MRCSKDGEIAAHARTSQCCLLTEDWGFADVRIYPPAQYYGIVVFWISDNRIDDKLTALRNLLGNKRIVESLPGRLAITTLKKIRLRPPFWPSVPEQHRGRV